MPEGARSAPSGRTTDAILAWLDAHGPATAGDVALACGLDAGSVRGRLVLLARQGLASAQPTNDRRPRQAYTVTAEGRRRAGIGGAQTAG